MDDWNLKSRKAVYYRRIRNFHEELRADILREAVPFEAAYALSKEAIPLRESLALARTPVHEGEVWGRTWESGYFRLRASVPESWKGRTAAAWIDIGGEGLIYSSEGEPLYGLTSGSAFAEAYAKDVYRLPGERRGGEAIELWLEAAANGLFGIKEAERPARKDDPARHGAWEARVRRLRLCLFDEVAWGLYLDMDCLVDLYDDLDPGTVRAARILRSLFAAAQAYREDPANAPACRALLAPELAKRADASALSTTVVGHAHIDTAWLWRLRETERKVARTYASQLDMIEKYPGYVFGASAAQHHAWMKEGRPGLYSRIKAAVAEGRWEPQGGMWVEADCNLPSGESLARQFLHGKNFWMDEFGVDVRNCWIPDVFGYAGSMPQILAKSGVDFFLTQKLSWSKFNEFPHDTFRWRGIDGTEVTTHFPPEYTYNSGATPSALRKAERTFREKAFLDEFVTLMGMGDGGGGPKEEHLERALRSRDLEGVPKASFGRADELFARLASRKDELEAWVGELYLEYHRGTYTTQARTKRNNRRLEQELRAVESLWAATLAGEEGPEAYPSAELDAVVKTLLLHQFHDIIPGSSVAAVYEDAEAAYAGAFASLDALRERVGSRLFSPEEGSLTLYNCLSSAWVGAFALPEAFGAFEVLDPLGSPLRVQAEGERVVASLRLPACGYITLRRGRPLAPAEAGDAAGDGLVLQDEIVLENELIRYRFDEDGAIVEAWDKVERRSALKPGAKGNVISYYQDTPHNFDAWDIDFYYRDQLLETARGVSRCRLPRGEARQGLGFELAVGNSRITQKVRLESGSKALAFETAVDWRESRRLLRVAFPLDSLATEAACEIAFGQVRRPTHANTEWDFAKFEVCAHRWVDISDADYGVSLLNDCKYGYSVRDNVLDLALLRSPLYPDPDADQGRQEFAYVLYPHSGPLEGSGAAERAASLNRPPLAFMGLSSREERPPLSFEGEGVSMEALKKAEKSGEWIMRLVETRGRASRGTIRARLEGGWISETDIVEWKLGETRGLGTELPVLLAPFEIRTYRIGDGRRKAT